MQKSLKFLSILVLTSTLITPITACSFDNKVLNLQQFPPWPKQKDIKSYQDDVKQVQDYITNTLTPQEKWVKDNMNQGAKDQRQSAKALYQYYELLKDSYLAQIADDNYQILLLQGIPPGVLQPSQFAKAIVDLTKEIDYLTRVLLIITTSDDHKDFDQYKDHLSQQMILVTKERDKIKPKKKGIEDNCYILLVNLIIT